MKAANAQLKKLIEHLPPSILFPLERRYYRATHEPELKLLRRLCDPRKRSLDIGANKGIYTLFLCKFSAAVTCFEPNPHLSAYLSHKFKGHQVAVVHCALGAEPGQTELHIPYVGAFQLHGWGSLAADFAKDEWQGKRITRTEKIAVQVKRLDDFGFDDVGFVKIDVEGFEEQVLAGATATLMQNKPKLLIEIEQRHNPGGRERIFRQLAALGYAGWFVQGGQLRPLAEFVPEQMQAQHHADTSQLYINNFIFVPAGADERP